MENQILKNFEVKLKEELRLAEERLAELGIQDPFSDPSRLNDNAASDTEAAEVADHDRMVALKNEILGNIERIKKALVKLSDGVYGKCEKCGADIDEKRLEIFPEAVFCFECEKQRE